MSAIICITIYGDHAPVIGHFTSLHLTIAGIAVRR